MKIFISYARKDKKLCEGFRTALNPLTHILGLEAWHDGEILPGGAFEDHIATALEAADVVVLLVSDHFYGSNYCTRIEMQRALERRAAGECEVLPVLIDFTSDVWKRGPLGKINALPANGKCVRDFKPQKRGWREVADGILRLFDSANTPSPSNLHHLPIPANPLFRGREEELKGIAQSLASGQPVALLHGLGGVGKTQAANEFAHRHANEYKAVWWVTAETDTEADAGYGAARASAEPAGL